MPIVSTDLNKYQSANMPEDDTGTTGGAIAATGRLADMPQASATAPKAASSDAGDTMNLTITGRLTTGVIDSEVQTLTGTVQVTFTKTFERILKAVLSGAATGTVTVFMNDGSTVIVALPPGITSNRRLFYDSSSDPGSQKIRYEKEFWRNDHGTLTLQSPTLKLTADPQTKIRVGVENAPGDTSTNRVTAPSGVSFVDDLVTINISNLAAASSVGLWVEQTLAAGDAAFKSTYTTELAGTSA